ncbi:MAG: ECF-type sigma factor [Planctomycetota bacterium]
MDSRAQVTQILQSIAHGDEARWDDLVPIVYEELKQIARARLAQLRPGQTYNATALVNEAYLRLSGAETDWKGRAHFFGAAARAMRNVLVDELRSKQARKRGGDWNRVVLDESAARTDGPSFDLLALDEALHRLEKSDPQQHEVVMLRYFAGLSIDETARALDVAPATVDRHWSFARVWLHREMTREP